MGYVSVQEMKFQVVTLARWEVTKSIFIKIHLLRLLLYLTEQARERPAYLSVYFSFPNW